MPELTWPRATRFHDRGHGDLPRLDVTGPATVEVPGDAVAHLKSRGWVDPSEEDDDTDTDDGAEEAGTAAVEPAEETEEDTDTAESADDDTPEEDAEEDTDDTDAAEAPESEEFDPDAFVGRKWHVVTDDVRAGAADDHLEAVREAEEARDNGPRGSVDTALTEREEAQEAE